MDHKKRILCAVGTRPEAIKMAPVINALSANPAFQARVLATAQHRELLDQMLKIFAIVPDIDLNIMTHGQSLTSLTARLLEKLGEVLQREAPDAVLAQGDTTTVLCVALACFYRKIPFGHVEAGLRTHDMHYPFPEEMNRVVASHLARWHFAPTESARQNLLQEGIAGKDIFVTGNTVIDALLEVAQRELSFDLRLDAGRRLILMTAHRRENFGAPFAGICDAVLRLAGNNPDIQFLYPVHPNPSVRDVAYRILGSHPQVTLCEPLDYESFVMAMKRAYLILSDSGGVQEEAPALGKPVLVLRDETERPEAVSEGVVKLVGTRTDTIVAEVQKLLDDENAYRAMARNLSPYGDGRAAGRIERILAGALGVA